MIEPTALIETSALIALPTLIEHPAPTELPAPITPLALITQSYMLQLHNWLRSTHQLQYTSSYDLPPAKISPICSDCTVSSNCTQPPVTPPCQLQLHHHTSCDYTAISNQWPETETLLLYFQL